MIDGLASIEFRQPGWLLLALQPLLLLGSVYLQRRRDASAYCQPALLPWVRAPRLNSLRSHLWRQLLLFLVWCCLAIALAGPRLADKIYHAASDNIAEVLLVIDLSRSMSAADVLPSRLERAKLEITQLLHHSPQLRIGVVVFAARPHLLSPPTADYAVLEQYVQQLHTQMLATEGSDLTAALEFAGKQFHDRAVARTVLLFTDGETDADTAAAQLALTNVIADLKQHQIRVSVVGVGTPTGAALVDPQQGWLQYHDQAVISRLASERLTSIATRANGHYYANSDAASIWPEIVDKDLVALSHGLDRGNNRAVIVWRELYTYPLLTALLLFMLAQWERAPRPTARRAPPGVAVALIAVLLVSVIPASHADSSNYRDAYYRYQHKDYERAAQDFAKLPGYAARMGEASALYRLKRYPAASVVFIQAVLAASDDAQRAQALFNLANCYYQQENYPLAIATYRDALAYAPQLQAAATNLTYAEALHQQRIEQAQLIAKRAGRGPRSATAVADLSVTQGSLSIDDSPSPSVLPEPPITSAPAALNPDFNQAKPAVSTIERDDDTRWTYDTDRIDPALLQNLLQAHNESYLWQRLFEWEENFPAPVSTPHSIPGVNPW